MNFKSELEKIGKSAKFASRKLTITSEKEKNGCLLAIADQLIADQDEILEANKIDLENGRKSNLSNALLDRLALTAPRIVAIAEGVKNVVNLPDPIGKVDEEFTLKNNLVVKKVRVPIGVIGIIYESRPNVTVDAASLCLKAGNAVILRGGSESIYSNRVLAESMAAGLKKAKFDENTVQLLPWTDRAAVSHLLKLNSFVDLIIPRGGENLIRTVVENATVPVIKHFKGVCHLYVDNHADEEMALSIIENAKCQRPGVCNAIETVLIHERIADSFAPKMAKMLQTRQVELRGDQRFCQLTGTLTRATEKDWYEEYLDQILSVRIVNNIDAAIDHIVTYGSAHSDGIISDSQESCNYFLQAVDSAVVYVNASTRFTDGGQFGMGAEIGISTDRLHARGPMGLNELTTYKYTVLGTGQIRTS